MAEDMRTELHKAIGLGSAHSGTEHFWRQRLTALANIPLFSIFIVIIMMVAGKDYHTVCSILANPLIGFVMMLMLVSGIYHMKLGMQVIIEDYIHHHGLRMVMLILNIFFCFVMGAACILALFKIAFLG